MGARYSVHVTRNDIRVRDVVLSEDRGSYCFSIKSGANSNPVHFLWPGMVESFKLSGNHLFFTGNQADGPPGIWQYDRKSDTVRCLASGLKRPFAYTKLVAPIAGTGTNASGSQLNYHVWAPAQLSPKKRYPLILGQTHYMWFLYPQVTANGGYYFASANRLSWWDGLDQWPEDVMLLYDIMAQNPNVDTNRVFLFATSAESSYLTQLVAERPYLWKGVILLNPVSVPKLDNIRLN